MTRAPASLLVSLLSLAAALGCRPESTEPVVGLQAHSFAHSEWSAPTNIGAPVNTDANELNPELASDELSLYFASNRPGGLGGNDIWVSRRACTDAGEPRCAWQPPENLGPAINSASDEAAPGLSIDGHLLFFASTRPSATGSQDIYLSRRANPKDDFGWGDPVNLGPEINTSAAEAGPVYLQSSEDGAANLYFARQPAGGLFDIYYAPVTREGEIRGRAVLETELSTLTTGESGPTLRTDGKEVLFNSGRPGGFGQTDLWVSTRRSVHDPWSPAQNLGSPMNSTGPDQQPSLSGDHRMLLFASGRAGGLGGFDIWMSTRTPSGN